MREKAKIKKATLEFLDAERLQVSWSQFKVIGHGRAMLRAGDIYSVCQFMSEGGQ